MKRSFNTNSDRGLLHTACRAAPLAIAIAGLFSGTAQAQLETCNAQLNAGTAADITYFLGEQVPIVIDLGAGLVTGGPPDYLDISKFEYQLDCTAGDVFPTCNDANNTVVFADSVQTDCTDENDNPVTFDTNVVGDVVTFTPTGGHKIRNDSNETCQVTFDVVVTAVSGDNPEKDIVQLTGWGSADGVCSNDLLASGAASVSFNLSTIISSFLVTKDFTDDNPAGVDVHLRCRSGVEPEQDFTITDPAAGGFFTSVNFPVKLYQAGELNCRVFEDPVPDGYEPSYQGGQTDGVGDVTQDDDACIFSNVVNGQFTCAITNTPLPGEFKVTKYWEEFGAPGADYVKEASVTIYCDREILEDGASQGFPDWYYNVTLGDDESVTVQVDTTGGPATCHASEFIPLSAVESEDDCGARQIPAGGFSECSFTNTVFFEGIPALGPRGLALLALLMLGTGLIAYRRFA